MRQVSQNVGQVSRMTTYDSHSDSCIRVVLILRKRIESLLRGIGLSAILSERELEVIEVKKND